MYNIANLYQSLRTISDTMQLALELDMDSQIKQGALAFIHAAFEVCLNEMEGEIPQP